MKHFTEANPTVAAFLGTDDTRRFNDAVQVVNEACDRHTGQEAQIAFSLAMQIVSLKEMVSGLVATIEKLSPSVPAQKSTIESVSTSASVPVRREPNIYTCAETVQRNGTEGV